MLIHRDHPTGSKWTCGECSASIGSAWSCDECHNLLCESCATRTHRVPAGSEAGKICMLVIEPALSLAS